MNDANGTALYTFYSNDEQPTVPNNPVRQVVVNGEVLGRYGSMADQRFSALPNPVFTPQSDFGFGYQAIDGSYPAGVPQSYAVGANDTLESIAKSVSCPHALFIFASSAHAKNWPSPARHRCSGRQ